jgi:hypothetical protein
MLERQGSSSDNSQYDSSEDSSTDSASAELNWQTRAMLVLSGGRASDSAAEICNR